MITESIAPTRIDLAGGTLDIWPLYLFHQNSLTINLAIDCFARVRLEPRKDKKIFIRSEDLKKEIILDSLNQIESAPPALKLIAKIITFFKPHQGINLHTQCQAPHGSGIGGSSTLNIALCGALNYLQGNIYSSSEIIRIAKDLEARVIKVPTGEQDYYAAMYGGLNALWLEPGGIRVEKLEKGMAILEKSLILCFSGKEHYSGTNNWEIYKRHIDGDKNIIHRLEKIKNTALELRKNILSNNLKKIAEKLNEEWENRKKLYQGVSTPVIEKLIKIGFKQGALAAKICGAGGGGYLIFLAEKKYQEKIKQELEKNQGKILDFKIARKGLSVKEI